MLLIKNGYLMDPKSGREGLCDIWMKDDVIYKIGENLTEQMSEEELSACEVIDR